MSSVHNPNRINGQRLEFGNPEHIAHVKKLQDEAEKKKNQCISCSGLGTHVCQECDGDGVVECVDCDCLGIALKQDKK